MIQNNPRFEEEGLKKTQNKETPNALQCKLNTY